MQSIQRNVFQACAGITVCFLCLVSSSLAQGYPEKPIRIVVGFAPGGGTDAAARLIGQKLNEMTGQPVIIENRPGGGGVVSIERVAKSPVDGYTLLMMAASGTIQSALRPQLPYDLERDLAPVSLVMVGPMVLVVHPSVPVRNVKQLVALARSQPGKLTFGSAGIGSSNHLAAELLNMLGNVKTVHVPYRGSGESVIGSASGQVDFNFPSVTAALPLLDSGRLRGIAISTMERSSLMPSLPSINESGLPGYDRSAWYGVLAPAGVPKTIVAWLNAAIKKIANLPEMKESFRRQGAEAQPGTPEQFAALIRSEIETNRKLVKLSGAKAE